MTILARDEVRAMRRQRFRWTALLALAAAAALSGCYCDPYSGYCYGYPPYPYAYPPPYPYGPPPGAPPQPGPPPVGNAPVQQAPLPPPQ
jgi:hypothetical protein